MRLGYWIEDKANTWSHNRNGTSGFLNLNVGPPQRSGFGRGGGGFDDRGPSPHRDERSMDSRRDGRDSRRDSGP